MNLLPREQILTQRICSSREQSLSLKTNPVHGLPYKKVDPRIVLTE